MLNLTFCIIVIFSSILNANGQHKGRIVGGDFAAENQFPYQISLRLGKRHTCGGSILNDKWILTAGHCVTWSDRSPVSSDSLTVHAGSNVIEMDGILRGVKKIIVHEKYNALHLNDLALLELDEPLKFSEAIQPIELNKDDVPSKAAVTISGWGKTSDGGPRSEVLKFNTLTVLSQKECAKKAGLDFSQLICFDHPVGQGACKGDSGGPAVWNGKLIGVASFIIKACGGSKPDAYARVSEYYDWINNNMK